MLWANQLSPHCGDNWAEYRLSPGPGGMNNQLTVDDIALLAESVELECKAAQGRNGLGELPSDFWRTYSAMANAEGGVILLGIEEKPRGVFQAVGLKQVDRVRKALWDNLHNAKQVNANLLTEQHIQPLIVAGKTVLRVEVPRASRHQRPVHVGRTLLAERFCVATKVTIRPRTRRCGGCSRSGWRTPATSGY